jgi:hypothetical protein
MRPMAELSMGVEVDLRAILTGYGLDLKGIARLLAALTLPTAFWCMGTFRLAIALGRNGPQRDCNAGGSLVVASPYV